MRSQPAIIIGMSTACTEWEKEVCPSCYLFSRNLSPICCNLNPQSEQPEDGQYLQLIELKPGHVPASVQLDYSCP